MGYVSKFKSDDLRYYGWEWNPNEGKKILHPENGRPWPYAKQGDSMGFHPGGTAERAPYGKLGDISTIRTATTKDNAFPMFQKKAHRSPYQPRHVFATPWNTEFTAKNDGGPPAFFMKLPHRGNRYAPPSNEANPPWATFQNCYWQQPCHRGFSPNAPSVPCTPAGLREAAAPKPRAGVCSFVDGFVGGARTPAATRPESREAYKRELQSQMQENARTRIGVQQREIELEKACANTKSFSSLSLGVGQGQYRIF